LQPAKNATWWGTMSGCPRKIECRRPGAVGEKTFATREKSLSRARDKNRREWYVTEEMTCR